MRGIVALTLGILLVAGAGAAEGQQTTERFIPMGQSPGVSGKTAYMGEIVAVDAGNMSVTVGGAEGSMTIAVTDSTEIWLDRSGMGQTNTGGSFSDLQVGRQIEVKYEDAETKERADWIKVAATAGG